VFVEVASFNIVNKWNSLPTKQCFCKSGCSMYGHIFSMSETFMSLASSKTKMSSSRHRMGGLETPAVYLLWGRDDVK
jgi:hypothetical protein